MTLWGPKLTGKNTRFALWAPGMCSVVLEIEGIGAKAMTACDGGWFRIDAPASPGMRYRFVLPDGACVPDPASRAQSGGVHGWSVVIDRAAHTWKTPHWRGRPWHEAIIQEVHPGLAGGFRELAADLPRIAALGLTAVQLMPIGAFSGSRGWGYDGVLPFAPAECYGSPDDLKALVDTAHELDLMILLDVVYNHFGPDGNYVGVYAPSFFREEEATPWGNAVAVDEPAVDAFFTENALMWLEEYRFDGLRFDAVHAIRNDAFLDRLASAIRARLAPERRIHLILENEANQAGRLAPGLYDAQWNDDFHNVMHVLLTGETESYYADFADEPADRLSRCLSEGFVYQGHPSPHQGGAPRGTPSGHLPPTAFVAFLQNHDQIGNRAFGERLTRLVEPARLKAATALLLLCPQIPLMFAGDETGSQSPFLFFTDFNAELADAVRDGRRREFATFEAFRDHAKRLLIPDPNHPDTFAASYPEPGPDAAAWLAFYRELIALRRYRLIPRLPGTRSTGAKVIGGGAVHAAWQLGEGTRLDIAINLGSQVVSFPAIEGEILFELDQAGAPASFAAWLS